MRSKLPGRLLFVLLLLAGSAPGLRAESAIDGIAAIVNKNVILKSEVDEQVLIYARELRIDLSDSTKVSQLRKEILDSMIEERLIVDEANKSGVSLTKSELKEGVDRALSNTIARAGSEQIFKEELAREGLTEGELREKYEPEVRKQLLLIKMVGREVRSKVKVSDSEIQDYYNKKKAGLPKKPEEVRLSHIFIRIKPDSVALKNGTARAQQILARINKGESFETVAQDASDDPSAKYGGDLGFFSRGELDPAFEQAAFSLAEGQMSGVVQTRFGFHIIKVEKKEEGRVKARHILVRVVPRDKDKRDTRALAISLRKRMADGEDFAALAKKYSDEKETAEKGGDIGFVDVSTVPDEIREAVAPLLVGEVSEPIEDDHGYHLFQVKDRTEERDFIYSEMKDELREMLSQEKMKEGYDKWVAGIKKKAYIEIRTWQ
ncbi:MAG: peptidylprolyl isomerase [Candidatus Eisenbacteria bacterium]|nr:peptidylprolyl isomerase [Candidatus Eisenbacteria bacterium]